MTLTEQAQDILKKKNDIWTKYGGTSDYWKIADYTSGKLSAWHEWLNHLCKVNWQEVCEEYNGQFANEFQNRIKDLSAAIKILEDGGIKP